VRVKKGEEGQNLDTNPNKKQTAIATRAQETKKQKNNKKPLLRLKTGIQPSYLNPAKLRIQNTML
jgi:hypothetical protein